MKLENKSFNNIQIYNNISDNNSISNIDYESTFTNLEQGKITKGVILRVDAKEEIIYNCEKSLDILFIQKRIKEELANNKLIIITKEEKKEPNSSNNSLELKKMFSSLNITLNNEKDIFVYLDNFTELYDVLKSLSSKIREKIPHLKISLEYKNTNHSIEHLSLNIQENEDNYDIIKELSKFCYKQMRDLKTDGWISLSEGVTI
ncbi:MAG: hypothetical protein U0457_16265 [Candidatus Sericytochromatia bacterium]